MKGPSLQKTAALSTALHFTIVILALMITRQANHTQLPSPYIVSLVGPASGPQEPDNSPVSDAVEPGSGTVLVEKDLTKDLKRKEAEKKYLEDTIAAMKAKKKIEALASLKKRLVEIKGNTEKPASKKSLRGNGIGRSKGTPGAMGAGSYEDKIKYEIERQWNWPDSAERNLDAIINIRIRKDGTISIQDFEKKSGNRLFDNIALKALAKASPVTPPPYEMEIGMKFRPVNK